MTSPTHLAHGSPMNATAENLPKPHDDPLDEALEHTVMEKPFTQSPALNEAAYEYCARVTKNHYENFPVASLLLPQEMRPAIHAIYAFSRLADDFADESAFEGHRLNKLNEWEHHLLDRSPPTLSPGFHCPQGRSKTSRSARRLIFRFIKCL